ncbi:MAG: methylenetetrahydrofolate reductase [NAD(P)H] [Spirochaetia bacterium]|nr:methylenetetrahydrofolate reductase [NAD(P)H] [Spirochaetota bacterium]MCX8096873.1 methylenetetrahydrofolate reductase [NAD(P)H] [Spirochaetota bacterium]MDW8112990.1 methylenetetrahydrofolate reductase [NAD(P)H] [Spirochaetia bacterium]
MKTSDLLKSKSLVISFEFFPPKDPSIFEEFISSFDFYNNIHPDFVSVTYGAGGSTKTQTYELVKFIKTNYKIPVMPHLTALTHSQEEVLNIISSYKELGIENILALRGDVPKDMPNFDISKSYFKDALTLVRFIRRHFSNTFSICVSAYPEGYPQYRNIPLEVEYLKQKFDNGGDFAITQMFFDNTYFYNFIDVCISKGINNPIIPGIMPITNFKQISSFASKVGTHIPKELEDKFVRYLDSQEDMEKLGIEVAVEQINDLIKNGFNKIHIYTLNRNKPIEKIVSMFRSKAPFKT